ncbi:MAG TPA: hypothetical protein VEC06_16285 [Paucimonas sp.]|nr:hypothetical protein [Paucimonas sp.]
MECTIAENIIVNGRHTVSWKATKSAGGCARIITPCRIVTCTIMPTVNLEEQPRRKWPQPQQNRRMFSAKKNVLPSISVIARIANPPCRQLFVSAADVSADRRTRFGVGGKPDHRTISRWSSLNGGQFNHCLSLMLPLHNLSFQQLQAEQSNINLHREHTKLLNAILPQAGMPAVLARWDGDVLADSFAHELLSMRETAGTPLGLQNEKHLSSYNHCLRALLETLRNCIGTDCRNPADRQRRGAR